MKRVTEPIYTAGAPLDFEALSRKHDWIAAMRGVPQDAVWHAEGDVWTHTRMVTEALMTAASWRVLPKGAQTELVLAALLHDVEKRSTTTTEVIDGLERIVSPGHARRGAAFTRSLLYRRGDVPPEPRERIAKLVRYHGAPLWAIEKGDPRHAVLGLSQDVDTRHLAMLAEADVRGRICEDADELLLRIELFRELCREHDCYGVPYAFASGAGRRAYLSGKDVAPDYDPYPVPGSEVAMMSGLPGAGKDTYIRRHYADWPMLSLDELRREGKVRHDDKAGMGRVIQAAREQARVHLRARERFVFNATNLTADMRGRWLSLFHEYDARVRIVYLEVPYARLLKQNRDRAHPVPEAAVERMIDRLELPGPAEADEVVRIC